MDEELLKMQQTIASQARRLTTLEKSLTMAMTQLVSRGTRVQIENFEGCFKFVTAIPTNIAQFKAGTILIINDGVSVYKICVIMNDGTAKSVAIA